MPKIETVFTAKNLTKEIFKETRKDFWQTEKQLKSAEKAYEKFDIENFNARFQKTSAAFELFNDKADIARKQMQMFRSQAEQLAKRGIDPQTDAVRSLKDSYYELRSELADDKFETFNERMGKQGEILRLTGNETDVLKGKMEFLKKEMKDLVALGVDPQDARLKKLSNTYKESAVQLHKMQNSFKSISMRMGSLIKSFVSAQAVLYLVMKAVRGIINVFRDASTAATNLEETMNLFFTTFSDSTAEAMRSVNDLSNRLGFAASTAMDALGAVGDMAIGFGATDEVAIELASTVTELTSDLMSFKNIEGDLVENVSAFTSGLLGNTKNLRRYGIIVRDANVEANLLRKGLANLTGEERELAKIQERLNIAIQQSPKAIGDMEKTIDSSINVTRQLKEEWKEFSESIGKNVNAIMTPIKRLTLEALKDMNSAMPLIERIETELANMATSAQTLDDISEAIKEIEGNWFSKVKMVLFQDMTDMLEVERLKSLYKDVFLQLQEIEAAIEANKTKRIFDDATRSIESLLASFYQLGYALDDDISNLGIVESLEWKILGVNRERSEALAEMNSEYEIQKGLISPIGKSLEEYVELTLKQSKDEKIINDYYDRRVAYLKELNQLSTINARTLAAQESYMASMAMLQSLQGTNTDTAGMQKDIEFEISLIGVDDATAQLLRLKREQDKMLNKQSGSYEETLNSLNLAKIAQLSLIESLKEEEELAKKRNASEEELAELSSKLQKSREELRKISDEVNTLDDKQAITQGIINDYFDTRVELLTKQLDYQQKITAEQIVQNQLAQKAQQNADMLAEKIRSAHELRLSLTDPYRNQSAARREYESRVSTLGSIKKSNFEGYGVAMASAFDDYIRKENPAQLFADAIRGEIDAMSAMKGMASQGSFGDIAEILTAKDPLEAFLRLVMDVVSEMEAFAEILNYGKTRLTETLAPLEPVIKAVLDIMDSLNFAIEPVVFALRLLASGLLTFLLPIQLATAGLKWFYDSIKTVIHNIGVWFYNLVHIFKKKQYDEFSDGNAIMQNIMSEYAQNMQDIWKPMDEVADSATSLADAFNELESLYKKGAISGSQLEQSMYNITGQKPDYAAANGANFTTSKPTLILAGERGREHVNITPAPRFGGGDRNIVININGAKGDSRELAREVVNEIRRMDRIGYKVG